MSNTLAGISPVFIDLETRSCADLPEVGGWNYAKHPTTRLLTVSWSAEPDVYHLWLPGVEEGKEIPADYADAHLSDCVVHTGPLPQPLIELLAGDRPFCAHNAWTFDQPVWEEQMDRAILSPYKPTWVDTYPLALACGMPGGLNEISKRLWGEGKYEAGSAQLMKASRCPNPDECDPSNVPLAIQMLVGKYNVQDVRLLRWLWDELVRSLDVPQTELDVLFAHRTVNARGVRVDRKLLNGLITLSDECKSHAVSTIAELTGGFLSSLTDLNSRARVVKWMAQEGLDANKVLAKTNKRGEHTYSLAKDLVSRFVEHNSDAAERADEEGQSESVDAATGISCKSLQKVLKVLELRTCALRVTDGKLKAALQSLEQVGPEDYRVKGMFVYHGAHTGRWTARRIQLHNLPKPKEGINDITGGGVWELFRMFETGDLTFGSVAAKLDPKARFLTPDDAVSAMMRSILIPDQGRVLAAADFAAIECRVLAWLAGEEWLLQSFWDGTDPYLLTAERIFGSRATWPPCVGGPKKHPYRQVGKIVELGSGYGLGQDKFTLYAAGSNIDLEEVGTTPQMCIEAYRDSHPAISGPCQGEYKGRKWYRDGYWDRIQAAAISACLKNTQVSVGLINFTRDSGNLLCLLPSGRRLVYRGARVVDEVDGYGREKPTLKYVSPRFGLTYTYGGKLVENIVQAVSRDILAASIVRLESAGMPVCLHVHDEVGASIHESEAPRFMELVTECPDWLTNFPLTAEGSGADRYAKTPPPGTKDLVYRNGRPL